MELKVIDNYHPESFVKAILEYRAIDLSGNPEIIKNHFSAEVMAHQYAQIFLHDGSFWDQEIRVDID